jgi:tRNA (guanosine-2'-O-)-methyltransferase
MGNLAIINALRPFVLPTRMDKIRTQLSFRVLDTILVLDNLDKEMNVHACLRTAESLGLQYVYIISSSSNSRRDTRSVTKGAQKWLSLRHFTDTNECISLLRRDNYLIAASDIGSISVDVETAAARTLTMRNGNESDYFRQRVAVVMGNEMQGCSPSILNAADTLFFIPQAGFSQSLNVSVATAISLSYFLHRTKDYAQLSLHAHKTRVSTTGNTTPVYTRSESLSPPFVEPLCDAEIDEVLARVLLSSVPASSAILKRAGVSEPELK